MAVTSETLHQVRSLTDEGYKYGFVTDIESEVAPKGLDESIIRFISAAVDASMPSCASWDNTTTP